MFIYIYILDNTAIVCVFFPQNINRKWYKCAFVRIVCRSSWFSCVLNREFRFDSIQLQFQLVDWHRREWLFQFNCNINRLIIETNTQYKHFNSVAWIQFQKRTFCTFLITIKRCWNKVSYLIWLEWIFPSNWPWYWNKY